MKFTKLLLAFCLFCPLLSFAQPPEAIRLEYAKKFHTAFQLLSYGADRYTHLGLVAFDQAVKSAREHGESPAKIRAVEDLFWWYRMFGYHCGLLSTSSLCPGEYKRSDPRISIYSTTDPRQQELIREFLYGVGVTLGGVFCVTFLPPKTFGWGVCLQGATIIWHAGSAMMRESDEKKLRLAELNELSKKFDAASSSK